MQNGDIKTLIVVVGFCQTIAAALITAFMTLKGRSRLSNIIKRYEKYFVVSEVIIDEKGGTTLKRVLTTDEQIKALIDEKEQLKTENDHLKTENKILKSDMNNMQWRHIATLLAIGFGLALTAFFRSFKRPEKNSKNTPVPNPGENEIPTETIEELEKQFGKMKITDKDAPPNDSKANN